MPIFGNTAQSSASNLVDNNVYQSHQHSYSPATDGIATKIFAYLKNIGTGDIFYVRCALYDGSNNLLKRTQELYIAEPLTEGWFEFPLESNQAVLASESYKLAIMGDDRGGAIAFTWNAGTGNDWGYDTSVYPSFPDPWVADFTYSSGAEITIYCEYEAAGGGTGTLSPSMAAKMIAGKMI